MITLLHDSHDISYREPFGARPAASKVRLSIEARGEQPQEMLLRLWHGKEEVIAMTPHPEADKTIWRAEICLPDTPCLAWYYFIAVTKGYTLYYGNNPEQLGGRGKTSETPPPSYQLTVYRHKHIPRWLYGGLVYQIFPDRFFNPYKEPLTKKPDSLIHDDWRRRPLYARDRVTGEILAYDFFGGNLDGITAKLDYLEDFGVRLIYLNPIFLSVSNHRFDTADYEKVDPLLGDEAAFKRLCEEAKKRGIGIMLDGVFSHTGSDSKYFNKEGTYSNPGAFQSKQSPFYSWYRFKEFPHNYESWWGIGNLPNVDELNPDYLYYIIEAKNSIASRWLKAGAIGWRLDVADELPLEFIRLLRQRMKRDNEESFLLGEVWEDATNKVAYDELRCYFLGDQLDSVMKYPFRNCVLDFLLERRSSTQVMAQLRSLHENYPPENFDLLMNLLGTHDTVRLLTELSGVNGSELTDAQKRRFTLIGQEKEQACRRLWLALIWQMTFPGLPSIYYGDEAGAEGFSDPYNRGTYPWQGEDPLIYKYYWRLSRLRRRYPVFSQRGGWRPQPSESDVLAYVRSHDSQNALVIINRSEQETTFSVSCDTTAVDILSGEAFTAHDGRVGVRLPGNGGRILHNRISYPDRLRKAGLLLHPISLPGPFGIGDIGPGAYEFVDFLSASQHQLWQILPLNPVDGGGSPYAGTSAFAGNHLLISPELLAQEGYLVKADLIKAKVDDAVCVDYQKAREVKEKLLRRAYENFSSNSQYAEFCEKNSFWLDDYVLYQALKQQFDYTPWPDWEQNLVKRKDADLSAWTQRLAKEIAYQKFLQYEFWRQWSALRQKANQRGVVIIGDVPIYPAADSADVWANQQLFELTGDGRPAEVSGVPPDYFSSTGQLWGNPLYDWENCRAQDYHWWKKRMEHGLAASNILRIDHFRALENYWSIPFGSTTAASGKWRDGPGADFFLSLQKHFGGLPFIAEDLGDLTLGVHRLRDRFALPGMDILQFGVSGDITRLLYTGTHDNDTLCGWIKNSSNSQPFIQAAEKAGVTATMPEKETARRLLEYIYTCDHIWTVIPVQDLLLLGSEARMNTPATVAGNWSWRLLPGQLDEDALKFAMKLVKTGKRGAVRDVWEDLPGMRREN